MHEKSNAQKQRDACKPHLLLSTITTAVATHTGVAAAVWRLHAVCSWVSRASLGGGGGGGGEKMDGGEVFFFFFFNYKYFL